MLQILYESLLQVIDRPIPSFQQLSVVTLEKKRTTGRTEHARMYLILVKVVSLTVKQ